MSGRIGIDVGGVITDRLGNDNTDTSFHTDNFLQTSPVEDAFEAISQLVKLFDSRNVYIVSKCGDVIERKTRLWLRERRFYDLTGFNPENAFFCIQRPDKASIAHMLGLTHFVDDRADVLRSMENVRYRCLFGPQPEGHQDTNGLIIVRTWKEALTAIMSE